MSAAPPVHTPTARAILAWLDERIRSLDTDEAHTADRGALAAYRAVRRELVDHLPYCESDALVMTTAGMTTTSAETVLALFDEGGDASDEAA